ncbi:MAG: hypothetical protein IID45_11775, partial [Planctomycetes bacterium]|nr:hypothetical protein [Planctomycetota bacterium]
SAAAPTVAKKKKPKTIAERLLTKIEIDFRRVPLQKAFEEIAEGTGIRIELDGDALKDSGYTKNMPQTFKLGVVSAQRAVYEIVKKYKDMVVIVDEKSKVLTVMTKKFAADKGLKPFPLKP